jgi:hypothetical protein
MMAFSANYTGLNGDFFGSGCQDQEGHLALALAVGTRQVGKDQNQVLPGAPPLPLPLPGLAPVSSITWRVERLLKLTVWNPCTVPVANTFEVAWGGMDIRGIQA